MAGPFVKARKEYEKKQEEKQQAIAEAERKREEIRTKLKEKQQKAIKLQMKTKRGQPIMSNLLSVMMEKIERDAKR